MLVFTLNTFAKDYVVVGVSGFGTRKPGHEWQPSGAHDLLPRTGKIYSRFELVHYAKTSELQSVIDEFDCEDGKQKKSNLGLIILANSWGSNNGYKLAKMYQKQCGQLTDVFYLVDGVAKPIGAFNKKIPAKQCFNAYQRKGAVRGNEIEGCVNYNFTKTCEKYGYKGTQCHIMTEWDGCKQFANHMNLNFLGF